MSNKSGTASGNTIVKDIVPVGEVYQGKVITPSYSVMWRAGATLVFRRSVSLGNGTHAVHQTDVIEFRDNPSYVSPYSGGSKHDWDCPTG